MTFEQAEALVAKREPEGAHVEALWEKGGMFYVLASEGGANKLRMVGPRGGIYGVFNFDAEESAMLLRAMAAA